MKMPDYKRLYDTEMVRKKERIKRRITKARRKKIKKISQGLKKLMVGEKKKLNKKQKEQLKKRQIMPIEQESIFNKSGILAKDSGYFKR